MTYDPKPCVCGHGREVHGMNLATRQCVGRCHQGNYGRNGAWVGTGCPCRAYVRWERHEA